MITTLVLWSYALAALLFGALALTQMRRPSVPWPHAPFVLALAITSLWALAVAGIDSRDVATRIVASVRDIAWLGFMLALVRRDRAGNYALGAVYFLVMALAGTAALLAIVERMGLDADALAALASARTVLRMMGAVSGLVLVHHLYQAAPASRGGIRLAVLALAAMWAADLVVSASVYFDARWTIATIVARGVVMSGVAVLLAVGVLGGFTTFSAFSLEVVTMIERGAIGVAFGYVLVSVIGSVAALFAGLSAVRAVA